MSTESSTGAVFNLGLTYVRTSSDPC